MALKAVVENLDDVEEGFRSEYAEKEVGGKKVWVLDIVDVRVHPDTQALKNALDRVRQEKTTAEQQLSESRLKLEGLPDDFDPAEFNRLRTEAEERQRNPDNTEAQLQSQRTIYEQRLQAAERKRQEDLAKKEEDIRKRDAVIERRVVDDELQKALAEQGVTGPLLRAAAAMHRSNIKTRRDPDTGEVTAFFETDIGETPVTEFLANWAKGDEGKAFVPKATGGGAQGGGPQRGASEPNPWKPDTRNLTQQGQIVRADPNKAERLIRSSGLPAAVQQAELQKLGRGSVAA